MTPRLRRPRPSWILCAALVLVLMAGCSSVVTGNGGTAAPSSRAPSSGSSGTSQPAPNAKFPRVPTSTSIGDPATADLCAAIDLKPFAKLSKYTASYAEIAYPPGCSIALNEGSTLALTVYVYGVVRHTFSHLAPTTDLARLPVYKRKIDGLTVKEYAFQLTPLGDCKRSVLASGVIMRVQVYSRAAPGKASRSDDCAAADIMTEQVAKFTSEKSVPRLALADPSVSGLDFCAALRAVNLSGLSKFDTGEIVPDGIGCDIKIDDTFYLYLSFAITKPAAPRGATPRTLGGHRLYVGDHNDGRSTCNFVATQGTTPSGYHEQVIAEAGDYSAGGTPDLCTDTSQVFVDFLDIAGLK